jgi:hypothetical protein
MKNALILSVCLFFCQVLFADMPGNTANKASSLQLTGVKSIKGWTLFAVVEYEGATPKKLTKDVTLTIAGGRGRPATIEVFARNPSGKETKHLTFWNQDGATVTVQFTGIAGDSVLQYAEIQRQAAPFLGDIAAGPGGTSAEDWLLIAAAVGLVALVGMYMRRKRNAGNGSPKP